MWVEIKKTVAGANSEIKRAGNWPAVIMLENLPDAN